MEHIYHCIGHTLRIPDIVNSDGVYVIDNKGKRYMDLESGVWCVSVGHRNPKVNRRISEQIDAILHSGFSYSSTIVDSAARRVRETGGKIIVNEVTTGIGRTGKWFGYQHYDIVPDIVAIGKGIGNGYPVSVASLSHEIIRDLEEKPFIYSQSHQNDPLGASVVKGVIDFIEESELITGAERKGKRFCGQLMQLVDGQIIMEVRGRGLMIAIDVCDKETTELLCSELLKQGFIVGNRGSLIRIDPPLTITARELDLFLKVFEGTLHSIQAGNNTRA